MIEFRWKKYNHLTSKPSNAVRMMNEGVLPVCAVLQYRETPHHIHYDPENNITAVPTEWQDVLLEAKP